MIVEFPEEFERDTASLSWWEKMDVIDAIYEEKAQEAYGTSIRWNVEQDSKRFDA